jgi:arylsulfatase A-like enzyme
VFLNDVRLSSRVPTLGTVLKDAGYHTGYIGKWHLDGPERSGFTPPGPRRQGFDFWAVGNCTHRYTNSLYYRDTPDPLYWDGYDAEDQTSLAVDFIHQQVDESPFALILSWGPPHNPYRDLPDKYLSMYPPEMVVARPNCPDPDPNDISGYYAHVPALDDQLGRLRTALEESGRLENTIFVFTSDHGDMLGSQGLQRKQHPWDESILVPFVMTFPGQACEGHSIKSPLNVVDIMPTLLGLADVPIPDTVEGMDHTPAIRGESFEGNSAALTMAIAPFSENRGLPWRGVRTERHTYARRLDGPWLLYDNGRDPFQMENLIDTPESVDLQATLEKTLCDLLDARNDAFLPPQEYLDRFGFEVEESGAVPYTN